MRPFRKQVDALLKNRDDGLTIPRLQEKATHGDVEGQAGETIRNALNGRKRGKNVKPNWLPDEPAMQAIADVLGVNPMHFDAFRIRKAQRLVDQTRVPPGDALEAADALLRAVLEWPEEIAEEAARHADSPPAVAPSEPPSAPTAPEA